MAKSVDFRDLDTFMEVTACSDEVARDVLAAQDWDLQKAISFMCPVPKPSSNPGNPNFVPNSHQAFIQHWCEVILKSMPAGFTPFLTGKPLILLFNISFDICK